MRGMHALSATDLYQQLNSEHEREVMLSAGGKMVGKLWSELPRGTAQFIDNDHFRMCFQIRLGTVEVPAGTTCQLTKAGGEEGCLHAVTAPCEHPHVCKVGPARLRPHRA
eukprot:11819358-Karenia_brevis.AAC.1